jgi:hypothetical protein
MTSIIPLKVYFYWHSKELPIKMNENINLIKEQNPEFTYYLYDEDTALDFLQENTSDIIVKTYKKLIPKAFKSDLFRLCILYKYGGIYIDTKKKFINNFKLMELTNKSHFVKDRIHNYIYSALIVTEPNNTFILDCINRIIINVKYNYYGPDSLSVSGPGLLGYINIKYNHKINTDIELPAHGNYLLYNNKPFCINYFEYYNNERDNNYDYNNLWIKKQIYN